MPATFYDPDEWEFSEELEQEEAATAQGMIPEKTYDPNEWEFAAPEVGDDVGTGPPKEDMGLFIKGWHRGKEHLQATGYGALGLTGSALGVEALKDYGYEGYLRNIKEAEKYPKEQEFLTIRSPLDAGKWALETFGEVAPSMIEAGVTATVGALAASAAAPGPGTITGGVAGFFGKRAVKNMLDITAKQYIKKGIAPEVARRSAQELVEKIGKSAIQKQAFKSAGAKAGIVIGISPVEAGGNWGEAMEAGIDNPWSALATGTAAGLLELAGGNIRIIDKVLGHKTGKVFAGAIKDRQPGIISRIVREAARQAPQEFLQESGQELLSISNIAYNDPTFERYTRENLERLIEAGAAGGVVGLAGGVSGIVTPRTIQNTAEATLADDQTYTQNRDQFIDQINKGFADGSMSIEDVIEAKEAHQHEKGESSDPKVISALNEIISNYEETTGPTEGTGTEQDAMAALESFKGAVDGLDTRAVLKTKDEFVKQYPWLEDQANEAIIDAQVYAGARKRVGILTPQEQAEKEFVTYEPEMPGEVKPVPIKPEVEPTSIFELQEGVKRRQAEAAAKEKELALQRTALPPGQGFEITEPKPETKLRPSSEKIEGPTYPEGAEYVAGKPAPEGLDVEHKPLLTAKGVSYKNEKQAKNALKYQKRFKKMGMTPKTHKVISVKDGFGIAKKIEPTKEAKLKEISKKVKAETPGMLKESDKVNDVTLGTLVDMASEDPAKALEHAAEATVSKAKLIEGLKNKELKAMGEAKSKEERAEIKKNLEETLRGIEEGEPIATKIPGFKVDYVGEGSQIKKTAKKAVTFLKEKAPEVPPGEIQVGGRGSVSDAGVPGFKAGYGSEFYGSAEEQTKAALGWLLIADEKEIRVLMEKTNIPKDDIGFLYEFFHEAAHTSGIKSESETDVLAVKYLKQFLKDNIEKSVIVIPEFKNTEEALAFGKSATPEQIEALKTKRDESLSKSDILKDKDDLQGAMDEAVRGQLFREAVESAEGKVVEVKKPKELVAETPKIEEKLPLTMTRNELLHEFVRLDSMFRKGGLPKEKFDLLDERMAEIRKAGYSRFGIKNMDDEAQSIKPIRDLIAIQKDIKNVIQRMDKLRASKKAPFEGSTRATSSTFQARMGNLAKSLDDYREEERRAKAKEEPIPETKSRLLENIKSEKGSSELINDLSRLGADAIKRGHKSFKAFSVEMKTVLGDAWAKVKHLMQEAYDAAKMVLKSEMGAIDLSGEKKAKEKDLPAFMQDFLAKAKAEPAPEFGSKKEIPPPTGPKADPEKVNSWFADNADSATKSIVHYLKMDLNLLEQVLASPEYYQHPVLKKIVRYFTRVRPETYHHYFHYLNDTDFSRENDVAQTLKDLKGKGLSWVRRQAGSTSKEYKLFKEMTNTVDIYETKDSKISMEEHLDKIEKQWRAKGATDDVIKAFRAQRGAYERGLALQRRQMEELLDKIAKKKVSKISEISFGKTSTKRYGKQYLEKPDVFKSFRTATYKTAEKWDLPSAKGINYVIGTYEKGAGQDVQSVNFDKTIFDEKAATEWWNKNKAEISIPEGDTAQVRELRKTLRGALSSMGRLEGTYAPRQRDHGDYVVLASKKIASGKIRTYRNHKVSYFAADRLAKRLTREGWIVKPIEDLRKLPEDVYQNIKTISVASALDEAARTMSQRKDLNADLAISFREDLIEQTANEIKARGFRASMIHRKAEGVVEGYNEDPLERLLIWMNSLSSGLAKAHVSELATREMLGEWKEGKRVGGIDASAEKRVHGVAVKYLTEQLRNVETSDRLIGLAKSITTFKYLGFNARSVTVNLTAMVTTVPSAIHQALKGKAPFTKIGKEIGSAGKDYAKFMAGKPLKKPKDQAFMEQIRKFGWDDPQYTREALANLDKSHERIWSKLMDASMYMFGKAEQWNRGSTMLATYRMAVDLGHNETEAAEMAKGASDSAHATYGKATYPIYAQDTNVFAKGAQLFYMYGKFGHNYVQLCYDLGMRKHNIKAFAWAALSPVVLAGGMVLPFKDEMFWFIGGILRALGIDRNPEKWWWDSVRRYLGNKGELVARHGVTGLMGGDISGSLSIGVGVPRGLLDLAGAPGGVVKDIGQAGRFIGTRQYGRAVEKVLPRGFENILRAKRERETGLVTQRGQRIWTVEDRAYQPSGIETGLRAAGFRSTKQAVLAERQWEGKKEEGVYNKRKSRIYEMYRAYDTSPTSSKHKKIRELVKEFNKDIKGKNISRITFESMKRQAMRMRKPTKRQAERLQ